MERAVYSVEETAEMLDVNIKTVYEGIKTGEIPSIRVGRRLLVPRELLNRKLRGAA